MKKEKIQVGIFFGGISTEHEVSISSAIGVLEALDRSLFDPVLILISRDGRMHHCPRMESSMDMSDSVLVDIDELSHIVDVAFPILHGIGGEDGAIQGFFEALEIPYVGNGITASATCLDKVLLNDLAKFHGIPQAEYTYIDFDRQSEQDIQEIIQNVKENYSFPVFVKPSHTGSSIGIEKVFESTDLLAAIERVQDMERKMVIEQGIVDCVEVEVAVLGNTIQDIQASVPGGIVPGADFYDYEDKYHGSKATLSIPAELSDADKLRVQEIAKTIYMHANCRGLARVDFFLNAAGLYFNEINTMPGFTPTSMYPKLWEASGLSYQNLITRLIKLAL